MGHAEGHGEDTATNVAAGSGVAVCFVVCFFVIGIPAIIAGGALLAIFDPGSGGWNAGLALIIISCLFLIIAIILVAAICTGCFGKNKVQQTGGVVHRGGRTMVVSTTQQSQQNPPSYGQAQPPTYGNGPAEHSVPYP